MDGAGDPADMLKAMMGLMAQGGGDSGGQENAAQDKNMQNMQMMSMMMGMMGTMMAAQGGKGGCNPSMNATPGPKKSTVCRFWTEGRCTKGAACTYAHGEWEIGMPKGSGKGGQLPLPSPSHEASTVDDEVDELDKQIAQIQKDIDAIASGETPPSSTSSTFFGPALGQSRPQAAGPAAGGFVPRKVQLCAYYKTGCTKGSNCKFAHGEHELGTLIGTSVPPPEGMLQGASTALTGTGMLQGIPAANPGAPDIQSIWQAMMNARSTPY